MSVFVVVPVKRLEMAKSRLSPLLSINERKQFCLEMLKDVLTAVKTAKCVHRTVVISMDETALQVAKSFDAIPFMENKLGLNQAILEVINWCIERGVSSILILPADIPLVTSLDLNRILSLGKNSGIIISPSKSGEGTNALLLTPPNVIPTFYGQHSFRKHIEEASIRGTDIHVFRSSRVALDIDTIDDLIAFLTLEVEETAAYNFLMKVQVHKRLKFTPKNFFKFR